MLLNPYLILNCLSEHYYWSLLGCMMLCFIDLLLCLILPLILVRLVAPQVIFFFFLHPLYSAELVQPFAMDLKGLFCVCIN